MHAMSLCIIIFFQIQHGVTTEAELLGNYSSISSLRTERSVLSESTVVRCEQYILECEYVIIC